MKESVEKQKKPTIVSWPEVFDLPIPERLYSLDHFILCSRIVHVVVKVCITLRNT